MRIISVANAFKEVLSVSDTAHAMENGVQAGHAEMAGTIFLSDGGDGFMDSFAHLFASHEVAVKVTDPLGRKVASSILILDERHDAVIETAKCSGLDMVLPAERDLMHSGSAGLGDALWKALGLGAERIYVGLGGSATCDGGIGMLARLISLKEGHGNERPKTAADLDDHSYVPRLESIHELFGRTKIIAISDVNNPLCGPSGAAAVFGPQKGADSDMVRKLDRALSSWADRVERVIKQSLREKQGAGAAGGLGFAFLAIGADLKPGAETILAMADYSRKLNSADGVITTEGRFDDQSFSGKAPWTAAVEARRKGCKAWILCGQADPGSITKAMQDEGVNVIEIGSGLPVEQRKKQCAQLLTEAVASIAREN